MREDNHLAVAGGGKFQAEGAQLLPQGPGVGHVAVVGGGDAAGEVLGDKGLDVL